MYFFFTFGVKILLFGIRAFAIQFASNFGKKKKVVEKDE